MLSGLTDISPHVYAAPILSRAPSLVAFVVPSPSERKWLRQKYQPPQILGRYWRPFVSMWLNVGETVLAPRGNERAVPWYCHADLLRICVSCR